MAKPAEKIKSIDTVADTAINNVFSNKRNIKSPDLALPRSLGFNRRLKMDGLKFLSKIPSETIPVAFFDPQYRGILDKLSYGNEGEQRGRARASLPQMTEEVIKRFIKDIDEALIPSGHLFLWMDKFHLCTGFLDWLSGTTLEVVDMLTWDKGKIGMGYRTRRRSEHLIILQKSPRKAKGVWKLHNIPDVWLEEVNRNGFAHKKPVELQKELIASVSNLEDVVIDPASGSFSVMESCKLCERNFLGCDING